MFKTVGRPKSEDRKKIERIDLSYELRNSTLRQIAERLNVTVNMIQKVLTKQLVSKFNENKARFSPDPMCEDYEDKMLISETDGSWIRSSERESWEKYKNKFISL